MLSLVSVLGLQLSISSTKLTKPSLLCKAKAIKRNEAWQLDSRSEIWDRDVAFGSRGCWVLPAFVLFALFLLDMAQHPETETASNHTATSAKVEL